MMEDQMDLFALASQAPEMTSRVADVDARVRRLGPVVDQLRTKGYTWTRIATWLAEHGEVGSASQWASDHERWRGEAKDG